MKVIHFMKLGEIATEPILSHQNKVTFQDLSYQNGWNL